ncbi:MAG TPA: hypothetical protein P5205_08730 [Candidatus Paceibacterota bacterium]|nr:hypothetical protein [Verrucomicrobiota bacterium]HSA10443.1 hypothetical protein [Candidatus Paceibacterota bacterium]
MSYCIETAESDKGKADILLRKYPSQVTEWPSEPSFDDTGRTVNVCVVDNGPFEAAAIAYSEREMAEFMCDPHDRRPRRWLRVDRNLVVSLNPDVESLLVKVGKKDEIEPITSERRLA